MMIEIDETPIICVVCGIHHNGGPTGLGSCPKGHTLADEINKLARTTKNKRKPRTRNR